ncbi:hypothetical protein BD626DRAFT_239642 [Schizophyllum amplum]|uniref:Uncharacterized protein n=1 Tax=Schizophyllum amplum TaxID=97359 RepID=A0A550CJU7_9AGAR|nr:hypothetical protein BD626DRAFT_239642 [Auriculariopsis ampla]
MSAAMKTGFESRSNPTGHGLHPLPDGQISARVPTLLVLCQCLYSPAKKSACSMYTASPTGSFYRPLEQGARFRHPRNVITAFEYDPEQATLQKGRGDLSCCYVFLSRRFSMNGADLGRGASALPQHGVVISPAKHSGRPTGGMNSCQDHPTVTCSV